jgi:hypothetical protein
VARNEILDEIYAARETLLAQHGGDVHAYVESARKRALASGRLLAGVSPTTTNVENSNSVGSTAEVRAANSSNR